MKTLELFINDGFWKATVIDDSGFEYACNHGFRLHIPGRPPDEEVKFLLEGPNYKAHFCLQCDEATKNRLMS